MFLTVIVSFVNRKAVHAHELGAIPGAFTTHHHGIASIFLAEIAPSITIDYPCVTEVFMNWDVRPRAESSVGIGAEGRRVHRKMN